MVPFLLFGVYSAGPPMTRIASTHAIRKAFVKPYLTHGFSESPVRFNLKKVFVVTIRWRSVIRDRSSSTCTIFCEKLTFLIPWYPHGRLSIRIYDIFCEKFTKLLKELLYFFSIILYFLRFIRLVKFGLEWHWFIL